jgi:CheY-like chemotaxis protein
MHGSIGAKSTIGLGSTFWVELASVDSPLIRVAAAKRDVSLAALGSEEDKRTILYVEDNLSNLTLIEQMLAERPHIQLMTAMQGQLGIELARQHSPDLILLDLHLPDLPGWDVLAHLQRDESTHDIPVVIISADATSRQIERLMEAGARAYLTKPLDMLEFYRVINEMAIPRLREESVAA